MNRIDRRLRAFGLGVLPFKPDALLEAAARQAGLNDFSEDATFREALDILCHSAEADAKFSLVGRLSIRKFVVGALVNRLRRVRAQKRSPEIAATALEPPLIVVGLPRSGTTFLHHVLTLDAKARPLRFWELMTPIPGPGPDRRREELRRTLADMKGMASDLDAKHHFDADNPEECMLLLDDTLVSLAYWTFAPLYGYSQGCSSRQITSRGGRRIGPTSFSTRWTWRDLHPIRSGFGGRISASPTASIAGSCSSSSERTRAAGSR